MKKNLHNGDVLVCKIDKYIYIENQDDNLRNLLGISGGFMRITDYDEELRFPDDNCFSINKIYRFEFLNNLIDFIKGNMSLEDAELIWERKPKLKEMTLKQISEELGYEIKIVKEND